MGQKTVAAIEDLKEAVVGAFAKHDHDLRGEVERVNTQIRWLIGSVALVGAVVLSMGMLLRRRPE